MLPFSEWRLRVVVSLVLVDLLSVLLIFWLMRMTGGHVSKPDAVRSTVVTLVITTISALLGLVLLAAWQTWDLAVLAALPFAVLFIRSWRGEIERSRKADALAALSHLTAELTASSPGDASISEFASQLAAIARFLGNAVVVDITNPLTADYMGLTIGHTTSSAEEIAKAVPGVRLVKGFNTVFAQLLNAGARGGNVTAFLASDDAAAKATVGELARSMGFAVTDAGPLKNARYLEPLAGLNIYLGYGAGLGTAISPTWVSAA